MSSFASPNPGSVNTYWMQVPQGLVVIDAGRNVSGGRRVVAEIRRNGRPVVAILLTHPHPDHVGGLGELHKAFPQAPIYASTAVANWMRSDPLKFYPLARQADADFPEALTYPNKTFEAGTPLDVGGVRLETEQFEPGESETATAYYEPATGALFGGDLTSDRATPALLEGNSCGWLTNLDRLQERFPDARTMHPGHGTPGNPDEQINAQRTYLKRFRGLVRAAVDPSSSRGRRVTPEEQKSILSELTRLYPGYQSVASLTNLAELNVAAVAREVVATDSASVPPACRAD